MRNYRKPTPIWLILFFLISPLLYARPATDPLPSWNPGHAKNAILNFIHLTTDPSNANYVPIEQRIATFDQDGTLWVEHPVYTQVIFALDRIVELAPHHPEWKNTEPFKSILLHDKNAMLKFTLQDFEKIIFATHSGMSVKDFQLTVKQWLSTAQNARWHRPYTDLVYQPMLEVLNYLRANGYKTYIVTGGGQDFVRAYSDKIYGIPREQIIGSTLTTQYEFNPKIQKAMLIRSPKIQLNDNFSGKPEDIYLFIGRRPYAAFGNSTGDQQMLEYTESGKGLRLKLLVHHDDALREYSYGPNSKVGTFSTALMQEANNSGWIVVSMKKDWKRIFAFDK